MVKSRLITLVSLFIIPMVILSACNSSTLEIGFGSQIRLEPIMGAAKSDHDIFDINNVTLDFYYGGELTVFADDDDRTMLGLALYFCNEDDYRNAKFDTSYADYQNIEGFYLVKFISSDDFNSGGYNVNVSAFKGKTFDHSETFNVPANVFSQDSNQFCLSFIQFYMLKNQTGYYIDSKNYLAIRYEFIEGQQIKLSKPNHTI